MMTAIKCTKNYVDHYNNYCYYGVIIKHYLLTLYERTSIMKKMTVQAKNPKVNKVASIEVDVPETVDEAKQMFGGEPVLTNALSNWKVTLQGNIRACLGAGMEPQAIQEKLGGAKMGVAQARGAVDPQAAFIAKFSAATPEKQKEMLEQLKSLAVAPTAKGASGK